MFPISSNFPFIKKDGSRTTIGAAITDSGSDPYTLPTASADIKGGVKIGTGLNMDGEVLNVDNSDSLTLLWENPGDYYETAYNIELSSSDYKYLICEGAMRGEDLSSKFICVLPKQSKCYLTYFKLSSSPEMEAGSREVTFTDATHLSMGNGIKMYIGSSTPWGGNDNGRVIPIKIYGVK